VSRTLRTKIRDSVKLIIKALIIIVATLKLVYITKGHRSVINSVCEQEPGFAVLILSYFIASLKLITPLHWPTKWRKLNSRLMWSRKGYCRNENWKRMVGSFSHFSHQLLEPVRSSTPTPSSSFRTHCTLDSLHVGPTSFRKKKCYDGLKREWKIQIKFKRIRTSKEAKLYYGVMNILRPHVTVREVRTA
jgi:hypothetical protein